MLQPNALSLMAGSTKPVRQKLQNNTFHFCSFRDFWTKDTEASDLKMRFGQPQKPPQAKKFSTINSNEIYLKTVGWRFVTRSVKFVFLRAPQARAEGARPGRGAIFPHPCIFQENASYLEFL